MSISENRSAASNERRNHGSDQGSFSYFPELGFPHFDGTNPRSWIRKCRCYFQIVTALPEEKKVPLATFHFTGKADVWFETLEMEGKAGNITWEELTAAVMERFDDLEPHVIVGEFKKLQQTGTATNYSEKFEELRSYMLMLFGKELSDEFFVASFISGLKEEIKGFVVAMRPKSLHQAVYLAKCQEKTVDAIIHRICTTEETCNCCRDHEGQER